MNTFFIVCAIAIVAIVPIPALEAVLATAASTLFESTPFILAGVLLAELSPRRGGRFASLFGCGCSGGPGALCLPVAAATVLTFGPFVAGARWIAALAVSRLLKKRACALPLGAGGELFSLLPFALAAGAVFSFLPNMALLAGDPFAAALCAGIIAAIASPCGFGAIALAATMHRIAPFATVAVLCIAGICDLRSLGFFARKSPRHDGFAYLIAGAACALLAWHQGNTLVNPRFAAPLWCCAVVFCAFAWRYRAAVAPVARIAPALMFVASIVSAPPPVYYASETTLSDAFAGEAITFRGALSTDGSRTSLVRFVVTCCRADAQPVAVLLKRRLRERTGQWIVAGGHLVPSKDGLELDVATYKRISAPADPFLYR